MASDKSSTKQASKDSPRSIAHDLANLLQVIDGFVKMAMDDAEKNSPVAKCLGEILTASTAPEGFEHLEPAEKKALYDILRETKPELAAAWKTIGS